MTPKRVEMLDTTIQKTNHWLRTIASELETDNRRHAYLALRGTLHAVRDFLPIEESAQLSAQLPMLIRGIYFEGWKPSETPETNRTQESFLRRLDDALERAMGNEEQPIQAQEAARAVLYVLSLHVSAGEVEQVRHLMPERVRDLWPAAPATMCR
jgi:uncharacterized protein (DUF2267 family)